MCQINASPMKKQIGCIDVQGKRARVRLIKVSIGVVAMAFISTYTHFYVVLLYVRCLLRWNLSLAF